MQRSQKRLMVAWKLISAMSWSLKLMIKMSFLTVIRSTVDNCTTRETLKTVTKEVITPFLTTLLMI